MRRSVALVLAAAAAASLVAGARGAAPPKRTDAQVAAIVKRAVAAEGNAIRALDAGNLDRVRQELRSSMDTLRNAQSTPGLEGSVRGNLRQAVNKDDAALDSLKTAKQRERARLLINRAIVNKQRAIETLQPPPPPKVNRAPQITSFQAILYAPDPPATFYYVKAVDPGGDKLSIDWKATSISCGWIDDDQPYPPEQRGKGWTDMIAWYHPNDDEDSDEGCTHNAPDHPGTIVVEVSDGKIVCRVEYEKSKGSGGPFDPKEKCEQAN